MAKKRTSKKTAARKAPATRPAPAPKPEPTPAAEPPTEAPPRVVVIGSTAYTLGDTCADLATLEAVAGATGMPLEDVLQGSSLVTASPVAIR